MAMLGTRGGIQRFRIRERRVNFRLQETMGKERTNGAAVFQGEP